MEKIVFVGAGSMAEAVIAGICKQGTVKTENVFVMNRADEARLEFLQNTYGISIVSSDKNELRSADLVVLATKPKDINTAMEQISSLVNKHAVILSVLAGISIATIESGLGKHPIARSMPNTSAAIGKSATGVSWNSSISSEEKQEILNLLSSIGIVAEVEEDDLHAVTALSGSGPAYVYYLAEALETAAIRAGIEQPIARDLIIQTIEGAACMLRQTQEEPSLLRENVTSPGGTTEAGLQALTSGGFHEAVFSCIQHAEKRSRELGSDTVKESTSSS
ncbi:pyrroline-5-carboxylate reductase [Sporosarcina gallistercoris]|uniref:Pyrroline-5-carboxylate reductase n=1 Tax=Sporosarcina gallistercoris TaxID=2762245 RepID=A0ABR8PF12_9BACL|nr:pyrroline-5-carboxylate reductase [Sporosarcina gallistercoris]MBD7906756.1 pyrroline-5-carboxylate reductase [Sporosarcina gallistercoris]